MQRDSGRHRHDLRAIARRVMVERDLLPDFSSAVMAEVARSEPVTAAPEPREHGICGASSGAPSTTTTRGTSTSSPWPRPCPTGRHGSWWPSPTSTPLVKKGRPSTSTPRHNTTSVYTAAADLPHAAREALHRPHLAQPRARTGWRWCSRWSSPQTARWSDSDVYRALVRNQAKLAYNSVAAWLDGTDRSPRAIAAVPGLAENLRLQDRVAQATEGRPPRAGRSEPGDHRGQAGVRRRPDGRHRGRGEEPGQGHHRGLHDRRQRRDRALPRGQGLPVHPPRGADAQALGPHRRDRRRARRPAAGRSPDPEALEGFLTKAQASRPAALPRSLARGHQAAGPRRVRGRAARAADGRATSAWPSRTTATPRRPTAATPT